LIKKDTWVQIHKIVLPREERSSNLPKDTKEVDLEMWVKGILLEDCPLGERARIKTVTNRIEEGRLVAVNPSYSHTYGDFVPEILEIDKIVKKTLFGDEYE